MSNHTPGPWLTEPSVRGFEITANDVRIGEARDEANARLIAAAPETKRQRDELLAALERTLSNAIGHACDARGDDCNFEDWPWVQQAREAIANATKEEA